MSKYTEQLLEDCFYHIYNRTNGNENSFLVTRANTVFLRGLEKYILPYCQIYAYCLLPNHFHLVLRIESNLAFRVIKSGKTRNKSQEVSDFLPLQFSKWFNSYSKYFNSRYQRKGSLFTRPFKRRRVSDIVYLRKLIHYVHYNPVEAKLCLKPNDWVFSSYQAILSDKKTQVSKNEVIELFDNKDNFIYCHNIEPKLSGLE